MQTMLSMAGCAMRTQPCSLQGIVTSGAIANGQSHWSSYTGQLYIVHHVHS